LFELQLLSALMMPQKRISTARHSIINGQIGVKPVLQRGEHLPTRLREEEAMARVLDSNIEQVTHAYLARESRATRASPA
jgi:hypothetical protein